MPKNRNLPEMSEKAQQDYEQVCGMADRLHLTGKTHQEYISKHMSALGYKPVISWREDRSKDDDNGNGGFFDYRDDDEL